MLSCGTRSVLLFYFRLHFAKCLSRVVVLIVECGGPKMENGFGCLQWASDVQSAAAGRGTVLKLRQGRRDSCTHCKHVNRATGSESVAWIKVHMKTVDERC